LIPIASNNLAADAVTLPEQKLPAILA